MYMRDIAAKFIFAAENATENQKPLISISEAPAYRARLSSVNLFVENCSVRFGQTTHTSTQMGPSYVNNTQIDL